MKVREQFPRLAVGLVHYPIVDREKSIVATNITNFDIHDIARAATVYGVEKYFIIHPMRDQLSFVERVLDHWRVGQGAKFNPYRRTALNDVVTCETVAQAKSSWGVDCITLATHARSMEECLLDLHGFEAGNSKTREGPLLPFGTGFGMWTPSCKLWWYFRVDSRLLPKITDTCLTVGSKYYLDRIMGPWYDIVL